MSLPCIHKKNKSVSCFFLLTNLLYEEIEDENSDCNRCTAAVY